jgi:hypothetical protein
VVTVDLGDNVVVDDCGVSTVLPDGVLVVGAGDDAGVLVGTYLRSSSEECSE